MHQKFETMEVMEKHKIYPKKKVQMNIPLYKMISMPVIHLALKINVLKMEHAVCARFLQPPFKGDIRWLVGCGC
jgi:hypothetical protein